MKGSLEKYLYFNGAEKAKSKPRKEDANSRSDREATETAVYEDTKVYHKIEASFSAEQAIFKVKGTNGIAIDDTIRVVNEDGEVVSGFINAGSDAVVNAIDSSAQSDGFYRITMDGNVTGAFVLDENGPLWAEFTASSGDKDPTFQAQAICYPVERFKGYLVESASKEVVDPKTGETKTAGRDMLIMVFEPLIGAPDGDAGTAANLEWDYVYLSVTAGKQRQVIADISRAINGDRNYDDGFISVFDGLLKTKASEHITGATAVLSSNI